MLHSLVAGRFGAYTLWWTEGSEDIMPSLLVCSGLPPAEGFAALLDGRWQEAGAWQDWAHAVPAPDLARFVCGTINCSATWRKLASINTKSCPASRASR